MSNYKIGVNLRVTENSNQGGRKHMEDNHAIRFVKNNEGGFEFAYFGIFDGHGGAEASKFARDHLLDEITKYDFFWSDNDDEILEAIRYGFLDVHHAMWREVENWPRTLSGQPSTAGTTASIAIIKNSKLYIGHVGDSGVAIGYDENRGSRFIRGKMLTIDHKPDSPEEKKRIEESGGQVVAKAGVQRVVWNRPRVNHKGPVRRSTPIDKIPFLAVARSLGDLWSYNYLNEEFVVSPNPDVSVHQLDPSRDKCLILGSDGLWNMMSAEEAVTTVLDLEYHFEYKVIYDPSVSLSYWINPAEKLVNKALFKWRSRMMKADNTSSLVVLIDPLGPRKLSILKKKREENLQKIAEKEKQAAEVESKLIGRASPRKPLDSRSDGSKQEAFSSVSMAATALVCPQPDQRKEGLANCHVPFIKSAASPMPSDKLRRHSLPTSTDEMDDSIQANSVHKKLDFTPLGQKQTSCINNNKGSSSTVPEHKPTSHNKDVGGKAEARPASVSKAGGKGEAHKTTFIKTRQRHQSNPCGSKPLVGVATRTSVATRFANHSVPMTGNALKRNQRAASLPLLSDSHPQCRGLSAKLCQSNNACCGVPTIDHHGAKHARITLDELKTKSNMDANIKCDLRVNIHSKGCVKSGFPNKNNLQKSKHSKLLRKIVKPRSSLRLKPSMLKPSALKPALKGGLRSVEQDVRLKRSIAGIKRKLKTEPEDKVHISKRLCTRH